MFWRILPFVCLYSVCALAQGEAPAGGLTPAQITLILSLVSNLASLLVNAAHLDPASKWGILAHFVALNWRTVVFALWPALAAQGVSEMSKPARLSPVVTDAPPAPPVIRPKPARLSPVPVQAIPAAAPAAPVPTLPVDAPAAPAASDAPAAPAPKFCAHCGSSLKSADSASEAA